MTKVAARTIVLIFWIGLFSQFLLVNHYKKETYPTFKFPSFGGKGQSQGIKNFNLYEVYLHTDNHQDSILYPLDQFLPEINEKTPTLDLIARNYQNSQKRTPEKQEFEDWVSKNLSKNLPDKEITNISILEVQFSYNLDTNELEDERTLVNYFKIDLQSHE